MIKEIMIREEVCGLLCAYLWEFESRVQLAYGGSSLPMPEKPFFRAVAVLNRCRLEDKLASVVLLHLSAHIEGEQQRCFKAGSNG